MAKTRNRRVICLNTGEVFKCSGEAKEKYKISTQSITGCCKGELKSGGKIGGKKAFWMFYTDYLALKDNKKEKILEIYKQNSIRKSNKVICLNTSEIFESTKEASEKYNIERANIQSCCGNHRKSSGRINGEKAIWMYYNDYLKIKRTRNGLESKLEYLKPKINNDAPVICLNTLEVFNSIKDASDKYNIRIYSIVDCCEGKLKSTGKINNEKAIWMYYEEYLMLEDSEKENIIKNLRNTYNYNNRLKVICLNNGEIFNSMREASEKYNIDKGGLTRCCKGKVKSAGKINGERARWMYYNDYLSSQVNK